MSVAAQAVIGALIVDPAALVFGGHVDMSARLMLCTAWLAWGMGIVSLLALVSILRRHAASALAALLLAVPAVTAISSAVALGEALHPASLRGDARGHGGDRGGAAPRGRAGAAAACRSATPRAARRSRTRAERRAGPFRLSTVGPEIERTAGRPDAPILLVTKLQPPFVPAQAIARERLLERLGEGRGRRLSLVACPAGFGKSTLLAAWRESEAGAGRWRGSRSTTATTTRSSCGRT